MAISERRTRPVTPPTSSQQRDPGKTPPVRKSIPVTPPSGTPPVAAPPSGSFTTSKGSVYVPHPEGGYTRHRSAEVEAIHKQQGSSRVGRTVFVKPEHKQHLETMISHNFPITELPSHPGNILGIKTERGLQVSSGEKVRARSAFLQKVGGRPRTKEELFHSWGLGGGELRHAAVPFTTKPAVGLIPVEFDDKSQHMGHPIVRVH